MINHALSSMIARGPESIVLVLLSYPLMWTPPPLRRSPAVRSPWWPAQVRHHATLRPEHPQALQRLRRGELFILQSWLLLGGGRTSPLLQKL